MARCSHVQIVFAPLPEEERNVETSAAQEFALRAAAQFRERGADVEIHHLAEWNKDELTAPIEQGSKTNMFIIFLISCGPDGSVSRHVRKTTKWIKEQETIQSSASSTTAALLGHAVCKTSAEQMGDQVFAAGRRLAKSLPRMVAAAPQSSTAPLALLETQVELEPPEAKFDGWVTSWVDFLQ